MKKYLFFSLILFSCNTQDFLLSSSYQHWVGGVKGSGSGINYKFKIVAPSNHLGFSIKGVYAHNYVLHYNVTPNTFEQGDTLTINGVKSKENWQSDELAGKIEYQLNAVSYSLPIKEMTKLEKLYYP